VGVVEALLVVQVLAQRVELAAVALAASTHQHKRLLELLIRAAAVVVCLVVLGALLAVLALSSCPIPCQKAQQLNSCLLPNGQHQQASLPLII
jgi:hypothetical protein